LSTSKPRSVVLALALIVMSLVWGSTWIVIKGGSRDLPPYTGAAARFVAAWLIMAIVAPPLARLEGGKRPGRNLVVVTGLLQFFLSYAIVYHASPVLPSGLTAVLWAVYPLLLGVVSLLMLPGERLAPRQWFGLALGFLGIVSLFFADLRQAGPQHVSAGLMLLMSPLVVAIANAYLRPRAPGVSAALLNRDGLLVGALCLTALALLTEYDAQPKWTGAAVFSVVYLAAAGTCLTFTLYFWTLRHLPVNTVALVSYVTPLIALTLGLWVGGEKYSWQTGVGTAVVLAGVALARRGASR
jgi:drug/metabolite transporter (DMT)-like permease